MVIEDVFPVIVRAKLVVYLAILSNAIVVIVDLL